MMATAGGHSRKDFSTQRLDSDLKNLQ